MSETVDYSGKALLEFLKYAADKGLIKPETARSRRAAVTQILASAEPEECADMRNFDLNAVYRRFVNKKGKNYKPESLGVYKSRFESALKDFKNWSENPSEFKPSTQTRSARKRTPSKDENKKVDVGNLYTLAPYKKETESGRKLTDPLVFPVPLEGVSVVISVQKIPADLNENEAQKITNVMLSVSSMLNAIAGVDKTKAGDEKK